MTTAFLIKTDKGLVGSTPADQDAWGKFRRKLETMKPGTWLRMEWARPRNGKHHRKMFALLALVAENSEVYNTTEKALAGVKLCAGYFDPIPHPTTGELVPVLHSIAFDKMEQEAFDRFYNQAIDAVLQHILPQMDREKADYLMDMIAEGWL